MTRGALFSRLTLLLLACVAASGYAQNSPVTATSIVSGSVFCGDSNAPARFAKVLLKPKTDDTGEVLVKQTASKDEPEEQKRAHAAALRSMSRAQDMKNAATTGMDGNYRFADVRPGTYYVHAVLPGYIDPFSRFSDEDFASSDPQIRSRIAQLPTITVGSSDSARIDLRLERGAAASGQILFDDGTPAVGWVVAVVRPEALDDSPGAITAAMEQLLSVSGASLVKTDDIGRFRIAGLSAGTYVLRASFTAPGAANSANASSATVLTAYSGDTFHRAAAKSFSLMTGEEHTGADIIIRGRSLHSLVGRVVAKEDGSELKTGSVDLTSKDDASLHLKAAIRSDGSFRFDYLPGGSTYTLTADDGTVGKYDAYTQVLYGVVYKQESPHRYTPASTDVALGDTDNSSVTLTVAQSN